eukprot:2819514-Prymnesium_polylepis.1
MFATRAFTTRTSQWAIQAGPPPPGRFPGSWSNLPERMVCRLILRAARAQLSAPKLGRVGVRSGGVYSSVVTRLVGVVVEVRVGRGGAGGPRLRRLRICEG